MVLFGIDYHTHSKDNNREPYLVVTTNKITDDIILSIDINIKRVIFQIPIELDYNKRDITFDFLVDYYVWKQFAEKIEYLDFAGKLVKNQFTAKHLACMSALRGLYIGSTDYPLFDNEDISILPIRIEVFLNGYGLVQRSPNMEIWLEKLKLNGSTWSGYI